MVSDLMIFASSYYTLDLMNGQEGATHIFRISGVKEHLNLQKDDGMAKSYQVKQVRNLILNYRLGR